MPGLTKAIAIATWAELCSGDLVNVNLLQFGLGPTLPGLGKWLHMRSLRLKSIRLHSTMNSPFEATAYTSSSVIYEGGIISLRKPLQIKRI
jgi:hypothetical protein